MKIKDFKLERYFAKYEFSAKYLISSSDCDAYSLEYILNCANDTELELYKNIKFSYADSAGSDFLRSSIAKQYDTINDREVMVMSPGEANYILMNVLLEKGDEVVCMAPAYQSLFQVAESIGANLKFWNPEFHGNAIYYNPSTLNDLVSSKTKLIIVNFPHNPTGFIPTRSDLQEIIEIARKRNIVLFSDEMYHQLVHNPSNDIPALCDLYENAISLWGMAKSFGLAGMRIGWLATKRKDLLSKIGSYKDYLTICNNAAAEVLTYIALNHKDKFIQPNIQKIIKNKDAFKSFVARHNTKLEFYDTQAGSTALVKLNVAMSSYDYCEKLVREKNIMMIPSEMFDFGSQHVRIGFGRENFEEVLGAWERSGVLG